MRNKGFTLVELLVVILIIGILSAIALPQYMKTVERARAAEAITILASLARAEQSYLNLRNTYTDDIPMLEFTPPGVSEDDITGFSTNDFRFKVSRARGNDFMAYAERKDRSTDETYTIATAIYPNGDVVRWCYPGKASTFQSETLDGWSQTKIDENIVDLSGVSTSSAKICKAISEGDARGIIK